MIVLTSNTQFRPNLMLSEKKINCILWNTAHQHLKEIRLRNISKKVLEKPYPSWFANVSHVKLFNRCKTISEHDISKTYHLSHSICNARFRERGRSIETAEGYCKQLLFAFSPRNINQFSWNQYMWFRTIVLRNDKEYQPPHWPFPLP